MSESKLPKGAQRYLREVDVRVLKTGICEPSNFIEHFPPSTIMAGLGNQPQLRANILVPTTNVDERIARKKNAESAAYDLAIALQEGVATPDTVVDTFQPDDRISFLDNMKVWTYQTEARFWEPDETDVARARDHIRFMLDCALENELLTHRDIVEGITIETLVEHLPETELVKILTTALTQGRGDIPFTDADLLGVSPTDVLVENVPLQIIWDRVIVVCIAWRHGFEERPQPDVPSIPPQTAQGAADEEGADDDGEEDEEEDGDSSDEDSEEGPVAPRKPFPLPLDGDPPSAASDPDQTTRYAALTGDPEIQVESGLRALLLEELAGHPALDKKPVNHLSTSALKGLVTLLIHKQLNDDAECIEGMVAFTQLHEPPGQPADEFRGGEGSRRLKHRFLMRLKDVDKPLAHELLAVMNDSAHA